MRSRTRCLLANTLQELLQVADRAIDAPMPQAPLHGSDVPVEGWKGPGTVRARSNHVVGDLLHWLELHGDVEPVDDMAGRPWHGAGQALQDFGAIRDHGDVAKAAISFLLKRVERSIPDCGWSVLLVTK